MDTSEIFSGFLNNYVLAKNGIKNKIAKFNAGETPTYEGFEELNNALEKATRAAHELYGDNGSSLDSDLDELITYLGAEIRCIQAETYLLSARPQNTSTLKKRSSIDTASKLVQGTRRNLEEQISETDELLLRCDESLKDTLFLYADTNLARKFYVAKTKFQGLFHEEDSLPMIFHYMYPQGNSVEAYFKVGERFFTSGHYDLAIDAFEDSIKTFETVEKSDENYDYKKDIAEKAKWMLKEDRLQNAKLIMEAQKELQPT